MADGTVGDYEIRILDYGIYRDASLSSILPIDREPLGQTRR
jgi:hypothetical protein